MNWILNIDEPAVYFVVCCHGNQLITELGNSPVFREQPTTAYSVSMLCTQREHMASYVLTVYIAVPQVSTL